MSRYAALPLLMTALLFQAATGRAAAPGDVGGWGDAWGEDSMQPAPAKSQRTRVPSSMPVPAAAPAPAARGAAGPTPKDVGGWGDAWGEQTAVPAQPAAARTQIQSSAPVPTAVQAPSRPVNAGPAPKDVGGWGDAWGEQTSIPAAAAPRTVIAPQGPVPQQAPTRPMPQGPKPSDVGGWGDVWADAGTTAPRNAAPETAAQSPSAPSVQSAPNGSYSVSQNGDRLEVGASLPTGPDSGEEPVQLIADQIIHDRDLGIVTAKGRVEVNQINRSLTADTVSYNLKQDVLAASGNVVVNQADGTVMFTEYFELTGDFKDGVAQKIMMILTDNSRVAARSAIRTAGERTDFDEAAYTACEPCRENPDKRPLWEAKAVRVTHNQAAQEIEYRDAWIELAGVPVLYTPYLSHPDPTVKRRSGLLLPTAGMSSTLGTNITTPYFWAINDQQDITFAPRFLFPTSSAASTPNFDDKGKSVLQRVVLAGEHRWLGRNGESKTIASLTADKYSADLRGHIDSSGKFDLSNVWRAGYQLQRSSDDTYTSLYGFSPDTKQPWLTTRPYLEGFGRRNYALLEGFSFQGLRQTDDHGESPLVLPHATFSHVSMPSSRGGYWTVDADTLHYARSEGIAANRLSTQVAWNRPFFGRMGDITELTTSLRGDAYHADHLSNNQGSANSGRVVPQVALNWRQPWIRRSASLPQVLEPMLMIAASPNGGNPQEIPNEDSVNFELDEINVMRANRMVGLDRVEGGLRGAYGLRWSAFPKRGGFINAQVGQGWRARKDSTFGTGQGFDDYLSDYVGRLDISPTGNLAFLNRVRLDKNSLSLKRNENTVMVGSPVLRANLSYLMLEKSETESAQFARRHSLVYGLQSDISRYWSILGSVSHDLTNGSEMLGWSTKLTYSDECFAFVSNMRRTFTNDRDILSGYEVTFNIVFKTLGDLPVNVF